MTGTLTAEYLPKISYDKNVNINAIQSRKDPKDQNASETPQY